MIMDEKSAPTVWIKQKLKFTELFIVNILLRFLSSICEKQATFKCARILMCGLIFDN